MSEAEADAREVGGEQPDARDYDRFFLQHQQVVTARGGAYQNHGFVGRGGNGTTFLTTAVGGPYTGLQFALKVFHKISNNQRRQAFLREIEHYKALDHPAIVRFYDEGEFRARERVYPLVLVEYVPRSLQRLLIESGHRIDRVSALRFALSVLSALKYLHERRAPLVHRDIKPGNILISGDKARLADFGLAKSLEEAAADGKEAADELAYAAMPRFYRTPELIARARGDQTPLTPASDIFQLGTVLYEMLSGFNPQQFPEALTDDLRLDLRRIRGECGDPLSDLIERMLAFDPARRPTAAAALTELVAIHAEYCARLAVTTGQPV